MSLRDAFTRTIIGIASLCLCTTSAAPSDAALITMLTRADVVFVGRIAEVGPCPGAFSGMIPAVQSVRYDVVVVLKGDVPRSEITVDHFVIVPSEVFDDVATFEQRLAQAKPCLDDSTFQVGAQLLVLAKRRGMEPTDAATLTSTQVVGGVGRHEAPSNEHVESWLEPIVDYSDVAAHISRIVNKCSSESEFAPPEGLEIRRSEDPGASEIVLRSDSGGTRIMDRELLRMFMGDEFVILSAKLSPDRKLVAIELQDGSDIPTCVVVLDSTRNCPGRELQAHRAAAPGNPGAAITGRGWPRHPIWLDSTTIAFLDVFDDESSQYLYVADMVSDKTTAIPLDGIPVALTCAEGQVRYTLSTGRAVDPHIPCEMKPPTESGAAE